jgi:predicted TIM-barrel fold metal-dependent hydrolase
MVRSPVNDGEGSDATSGPTVIDTHTHSVSTDRVRYPLHPGGVGSQWWKDPDRDAEALLAVLGDSRVDRAVLVQPIGAYGYDNTYVLDAADRHAGRLVAVPAVDLDEMSTGPGLDDRVRHLAAAPHVVGVRLFGVSPGCAWPMDAERAAAGLAAVEKSGLVAILTLFDRQVAALAPVLLRSGSPMALDHCGFPQLAAGRLPRDAPLRLLRGAGHVGLKVTSHLLHQAAEQADPARLVEQLAELFGPDRLLWGSDYPQSAGGYRAMIELATAASAPLGRHGQADFFGRNAARLFGSPELW